MCTLQAPQQLLSDNSNNYLRISSDIDFGIRRITDPSHNSTGTPLDLLLPLASSACKPQSYLEQLAGRPGIYMRGLGLQVPASSHHKVHLLDIRWVPIPGTDISCFTLNGAEVLAQWLPGGLQAARGPAEVGAFQALLFGP